MRPRAASLFTLPALLIASCGDLPEREVGFDSPDPAGRMDALARAARERDRAAIPGLIGQLESDDSAQRMLANRELVTLTGQDFGYHHAAPEGERFEAASRWKAWWASENGAARQGSRAGYPEGSDPAPTSAPGARPFANPGGSAAR